MKTPKIGDKVRDRVSGLEGIVVARTEHLNMCDRYTVQPQVKADKPDKYPQAYSLDIADLTVIEENAIGLSAEELARHTQQQLPLELVPVATGGPAEAVASHGTAVER